MSRIAPGISPALAVALVVALPGCGGGDAPARTATSPAAAAALNDPGAAGIVDAGVARGVPLGVSSAALVRRLGPPAERLRRRRLSCLLYRMAEQPPNVFVQFCLRRDRLQIVATYVR